MMQLVQFIVALVSGGINQIVIFIIIYFSSSGDGRERDKNRMRFSNVDALRFSVVYGLLPVSLFEFLRTCVHS